MQGISFSKDGLSYKGSQVDRSFSFSKLDTQLSRNNYQAQPIQAFTPNTPQSQMQHSQANEYTTSDTLIGGLFDIPLILDGTDPEEEAFRKQMQRKKKKGIRR